MKKILDLISQEMKRGFEEAGYDGELGRVTLSNRPDLCEYQCNGAMAGAKKYHKAPLMIANDVAEKLAGSQIFSEVAAAAPGFLNLKLSEDFLSNHLKEMASAEKFGMEAPEKRERIILDYGGPNVAKPLHVGHLRTAVIGESLKRIAALMLGEYKEPLAAKGIGLSWTEAALALLCEKAKGGKFGARDLRRVIRKEVEDAIAGKIISGEPLTAIEVDTQDGDIVLHC